MDNIKIAKTNYPVIDLITTRWSARSFSEKEITQEDLLTLIEAGSWAFSANNEQPWRVIKAHKGSETFQKIVDCLMPGNSPWAKHAAAFVVSIAKTDFEKEGHPYNATAEHDLGAFNAMMILQARSMDIYAHPMGGFDHPKLKEVFDLSDNLKPIVVIALGYIDTPEKLQEPYKTREITVRTRKSLNEIIL